MEQQPLNIDNSSDEESSSDSKQQECTISDSQSESSKNHDLDITIKPHSSKEHIKKQNVLGYLKILNKHKKLQDRVRKMEMKKLPKLFTTKSFSTESFSTASSSTELSDVTVIAKPSTSNLSLNPDSQSLQEWIPTEQTYCEQSSADDEIQNKEAKEITTHIHDNTSDSFVLTTDEAEIVDNEETFSDESSRFSTPKKCISLNSEQIFEYEDFDLEITMKQLPRKKNIIRSQVSAYRKIMKQVNALPRSTSKAEIVELSTTESLSTQPSDAIVIAGPSTSNQSLNLDAQSSQEWIPTEETFCEQSSADNQIQHKKAKKPSDLMVYIHDNIPGSFTYTILANDEAKTMDNEKTIDLMSPAKSKPIAEDKLLRKSFNIDISEQDLAFLKTDTSFDELSSSLTPEKFTSVDSSERESSEDFDLRTTIKLQSRKKHLIRNWPQLSANYEVTKKLKELSISIDLPKLSTTESFPKESSSAEPSDALVIAGPSTSKSALNLDAQSSQERIPTEQTFREQSSANDQVKNMETEESMDLTIYILNKTSDSSMLADDEAETTDKEETIYTINPAESIAKNKFVQKPFKFDSRPSYQQLEPVNIDSCSDESSLFFDESSRFSTPKKCISLNSEQIFEYEDFDLEITMKQLPRKKNIIRSQVSAYRKIMKQVNALPSSTSKAEIVELSTTESLSTQPSDAIVIAGPSTSNQSLNLDAQSSQEWIPAEETFCEQSSADNQIQNKKAKKPSDLTMYIHDNIPGSFTNAILANDEAETMDNEKTIDLMSPAESKSMAEDELLRKLDIIELYPAPLEIDKSLDHKLSSSAISRKSISPSSKLRLYDFDVKITMKPRSPRKNEIIRDHLYIQGLKELKVIKKSTYIQLKKIKELYTSTPKAGIKDLTDVSSEESFSEKSFSIEPSETTVIAEPNRSKSTFNLESQSLQEWIHKDRTLCERSSVNDQIQNEEAEESTDCTIFIRDNTLDYFVNLLRKLFKFYCETTASASEFDILKQQLQLLKSDISFGKKMYPNFISCVNYNLETVFEVILLDERSKDLAVSTQLENFRNQIKEHRRELCNIKKLLININEDETTYSPETFKTIYLSEIFETTYLPEIFETTDLPEIFETTYLPKISIIKSSFKGLPSIKPLDAVIALPNTSKSVLNLKTQSLQESIFTKQRVCKQSSAGDRVKNMRAKKSTDLTTYIQDNTSNSNVSILLDDQAEITDNEEIMDSTDPRESKSMTQNDLFRWVSIIAQTKYISFLILLLRLLVRNKIVTKFIFSLLYFIFFIFSSKLVIIHKVRKDEIPEDTQHTKRKVCTWKVACSIILILVLFLLYIVLFHINQNETHTFTAVDESEKKILGHDETVRVLTEYLQRNTPLLKVVALIGGTSVGKPYTVDIIKKKLRNRSDFSSSRPNFIVLENLRAEHSTVVVNYAKAFQETYGSREFIILAVFKVEQIDGNSMNSMDLNSTINAVKDTFVEANIVIKIIPYEPLNENILEKYITSTAEISGRQTSFQDYIDNNKKYLIEDDINFCKV